MTDKFQALQAAANRCTRVNAEVALLCEAALSAAEAGSALLEHTEAGQIACIVNIREAVGDPMGRMMQDELVAHIRGIVAERDALRQIVSDCATACGAGCDASCSLDFMQHIPGEIRLVVEALRKDAEQWRAHVGKLDALVTYCPTCCQGFTAQKAMTRDEVIFECGRTAGRSALRSALALAVDHIEMDALRISHGKDAAAIDAALGAVAREGDHG